MFAPGETIWTYHFKNIQLVLSCLPILVPIYTYRQKPIYYLDLEIMISSTSKLCIVFMFICLVVLLISTSGTNYLSNLDLFTLVRYSILSLIYIFYFIYLFIFCVEAGDKICKVKYHTKSEFGCVKSACNEVCINIEHATYGYCVPPIPYFSFCFCYLKC